MCAGRLSSNRLSIMKGVNPATLLDWVSLLFCFPSVAVFYRLDLMLRHGRDVHPTWVTFTMTGTLRVWTVVLCESTKFEVNLVSF
jgi:hypothetical protein